MIKNLSEYFLPEHEFYLHKIVYERLDNVTSEETVPTNCADNINVKVDNNGGVKVRLKETILRCCRQGHLRSH